MKKLIVTGVTGFMGSRVAAYYRDRAEVFAADRKALDFTDREAVHAYLKESGADTLIHCGAISDMGVCERDPEGSYIINTLGPVYLSEACAENNIKYIFCSSDQVYSGTEGFEPFREAAALSPRSVYAREKLEAEQKILLNCPDAVCLRLSWMYGADRFSEKEHRTPLLTLLQSVRNGEDLYRSSRSYRGITYIDSVVTNLEKAASLPGGAYNFGSMNTLSDLETVRYAVRLLGGNPYKVHESGSPSVPLSSLRMDQSRINSFGITFPSTVEGLTEAVEKLFKQQK